MIPKNVIPYLRTRRTFTGTVKEILYKRNRPIKFIIKNIKDENDSFVISSIRIDYKKDYKDINLLSKISFTAFIQPYIAKVTHKGRTVGEKVTIKLIKLSKIKFTNKLNINDSLQEQND